MSDLQSLQSVLSVHGGHLHPSGPLPGPFVIDSREVTSGAIFAALPGTRTDGHEFLKEAMANGAAVLMVDADRVAADAVFSDVCTVRCTDVLSALQELAGTLLRRKPGMRRIGITGSAGKTGTKEALAAILGQRFRTVMTRANYNSAIGLPLEVLRFDDDAEVAVLEMGMNRPGEIAELAAIATPDPVLITNVGSAHAGMVGGPDGVLREKLSIVWSQDLSVVAPGDDDRIKDALRSHRGPVVWHEDPPLSWGRRGVRLELAEGVIELMDQGQHHARNAMCAIHASRLLGCQFADWKAGLESTRPLAGRAHITRGSWTLIDDTYNASPASMRAGIRMAAAMAQRESLDLWLVLGEMAELGDWASKAWAEVHGDLAGLPATRIVLVGSIPQPPAALPVDPERVADAQELAARLRPEPGVLIYLKAANALGLSRVAHSLRGQLQESLEVHRA